jgi:hypothetical protein
VGKGDEGSFQEDMGKVRDRRKERESVVWAWCGGDATRGDKHAGIRGMIYVTMMARRGR